MTRDPYSFFITVVSQTRKPDGILAWKQFGLPGQKCRIVKRIVIKLCATWTFLICALFLWFAEVSWNLTDSKQRKEQPSTNTLIWAIIFPMLEAYFTDLAKRFVPWCRGCRLRLGDRFVWTQKQGCVLFSISRQEVISTQVKQTW